LTNGSGFGEFLKAAGLGWLGTMSVDGGHDLAQTGEVLGECQRLGQAGDALLSSDCSPCSAAATSIGSG
jgi:hypothetical protein